MYSSPGSLKQWVIFTIKYNQVSLITDHFIMLSRFRPLFYHQRLCVFDDLRFFVVYEWHTITDPWGCQTCEALGNEPLVWNMVSMMKWSIAKDNGCIWTIKLYLSISTAACCWRSRLLRAFIDQLLILSLFQISVAQVMIYVYTVCDLTSRRKIICKGILKYSKLKCDAPVMVIFCAQCMMYTDNSVKWQSQPVFPFVLSHILLQILMTFHVRGVHQMSLLRLVFGAHWMCIIVHSLKLRRSLLNYCKWFVI